MKFTASYVIHGCIDVEADTKEKAAEKVSEMSLEKLGLDKDSLGYIISVDPEEVEVVGLRKGMKK